MEKLVQKIKDLNINIDVVGDNLKLDIPKGIDAKEIIGEIKANKEELIDFIKRLKLKNQATKITPAEVREYYGLSYAQSRIYFISELYNDTTLYNMPFYKDIKGPLNVEKLEDSLHKVVMRHESFRTSFRILDRIPAQKIHRNIEFAVEKIEGTEEEVNDIIKQFIRPFDLTNAPLIRVGLIRIHDEHHVLIIDMHHIISDGFSLNVLIQDFKAFYNDESLPKLNIHYKDFSVWQQSAAQQQVIQRQQEFWKKQFEKEITLLNLPSDYPRGGERNFEGGSYSFKLNEQQTAGLIQLSQEQGVTLFMTLLAVYNIMLSKFSNQEDIVVGTPISGRTHADVADIVGIFINTLALRNYPKKELTFVEFLESVKSSTLGTFDNADYPFEELIAELNLEREIGRHSFFDVIFSLKNFSKEEFEISGLTISPLHQESDSTKFDLSLGAQQMDNEIIFGLQYASKVFKPETIVRFTEAYKEIVNQIIADRTCTLSEIDILGEVEQASLTQKLCGEVRNYPLNKGILGIFEENVARFPDQIAIESGDESISYRELNDRANYLAGKIVAETGGKNEAVGLFFEPSIAYYISLMAILKAGGTYLSLSRSLSVDRNQFMLEDAGVGLLLISERLKPEARELTDVGDIKTLTVTRSGETLEQNPVIKRSLEDITYIIYTSGSTGKPKGVTVKDQGILNTALFYQEAFQIEAGTRVSQMANQLFDASAMELFPCFLGGGSLVIVPEDIRYSPEEMEKWLAIRSIEVAFLPPVLAEPLLKKEQEIETQSLKVLTIGGDRLNYIPKTQLPFKVFNLYGPTEDSIVSTYHEVLAGAGNDPYLIGRPIANKQLHILDSNGKMVPEGVTGELCVSGIGVANGYLNNDELTRQKFIANPNVPGQLIYRTGDQVRLSGNGNVEFIGRIDEQVKINGYRIEPGEVQNNVLEFEGVREALVTTYDPENGKTILVCYYTAEEVIDEQGLKGFLYSKLPKYMIPKAFVSLDYFPISTSGKIDKKRLPAPEIRSKTGYISPKSDTETKLIRIWSELLDIPSDQIGAEDNFFEIGGSSIKTFELKESIKAIFDVEVDIVKLFEYSSVASMAAFITSGDETEKEEQEQLEITEKASLDIFDQTLKVIE